MLLFFDQFSWRCWLVMMMASVKVCCESLWDNCWLFSHYFVQLFDKEVKSFVYVLDGTAEKSKMQLPKDMKQGCEYINTYLHAVCHTQMCWNWMQHLRNFTHAFIQACSSDKCCQQNLCTVERELDTFIQYWVNRIFTWICYIYLICRVF